MKKKELFEMTTKEIFEKTGKIGNEIGKLREKIENLNMKYLEMTELCSHEIVFKYNDNYARKAMIDGNYFCPACGKIIKCFGMDKIYDTQFKDSRIIPLTNLSLLGTPENHHIIRNEVYDNMDVYYDPIIPIEELSSKMEEKLVKLQTQYEEPTKKLKKILK